MPQPSHPDIAAKLDQIIHLIGEESSDGLGGTGLIGRISRMEAKLARYDQLQAWARGVAIAIGVAVSFVAFMFGDKIKKLFA